MKQLPRQAIRPLARGIALTTLALTACHALPPPASPVSPDSPRSRPSQPAAVRSQPARATPSDDEPTLTRPAWDGTRKLPLAATPLAYPATWQGSLTVRDVAMVASTLYTIDRTLQAVPVTGGKWALVPFGGLTDLTRLASDGQHLFAGTREGQVLGLDPANGKFATLASLPSSVTGLAVGPNALFAGTERDGVYRVPLSGGSAVALGTDQAESRRVQDLALGDQVVYTLGDRLWAWPMDGSAARPIAGSEGATALTAHRGVLYAGTADGWLMRSRDQGATLQALGRVVDSPLEAVGTDGAWLYASSGNTAYMLDLKAYSHSLCHAGFAGAVTNLTVMDGATVLVGTRAQGLTSMPR